MKDNYFHLFLSMILGLLFTGTVIFSYLFGNFGGISIKELNDEYLLKEELSFSDLPAEEQDKHISNNTGFQALKSKEDRIFDSEGNPIAQRPDGMEELLGSLQEKVLFLEKENMLLAADKNELLKIVEHEKSKSTVDKKINELKVDAIKNKNKALELDDYKSILKVKNKSTIFEQGRKDQKITVLQNKINKMILEKNSLLTKNSQILMQVEV